MTAPWVGHRVLILDNYDSYVFNLYQRIGELTGLRARVVRNDRVTLAELRAFAPTHIVISPGPGNPEDASYFGVCADVVRELGPHVPTLGVCLGHQGIGHVFGARVVRAPRVMHGKTSLVQVTGDSPLWRGLPRPFRVMRYHSLILDPGTIPASLRITATTSDGVIMGIQHVRYPIHGVQFHPESIGTLEGPTLLENFLRLEGPHAQGQGGPISSEAP